MSLFTPECWTAYVRACVALEQAVATAWQRGLAADVVDAARAALALAQRRRRAVARAQVPGAGGLRQVAALAGVALEALVDPRQFDAVLQRWTAETVAARAALYAPGAAADVQSEPLDPPWGGAPGDAPDADRYPRRYAAWLEARRQRALGPSARRLLLLALVGAAADLQFGAATHTVAARAQRVLQTVLAQYGLDCTDYGTARRDLAAEGDVRPAPWAPWWRRWGCGDEAEALCLVLDWARRVLRLCGVQHPADLWRRAL
ncbi:MAG: hypothetical protein IRZ14_20780 [Chloroflexi bacterium]|nr:hypothetical protein [Chloroflexota bacterium]